MKMLDRRLFYKTEEEIEIIQQNGEILGKTHAEIAKLIRPGITTEELNKVAEVFIADNQATPSFKGYKNEGYMDFPSALCISVNDVVVHGFPSKYELKEGDIISVDCGVFKNGFHADSAFTYEVGEVKPEIKKLLKITRESLQIGIKEAIFGGRVGDISFAIQKYVEKNGFSVVRELVGHGVGRTLHEMPDVANYGKRGQGHKLLPGLVLAIEPMINMGKKAITQDNDGWTIRTGDRKPSAHFEHTIVIRKTGLPEELTTFKYIEEVLQKKK